MNKNNPVLNTLIRLGISLGVTVAVAFVLLLISTAVAYNMEDPTGMIKTVSLISLFLTALTGGVVSSRIGEREYLPPIVFSMLTGVLYVLLSLLLTVIPVNSEAGVHDIPKIIVYLGIIAVFSLGGVIGRPREKKRLPYKRKYKR